jgi:hypothetical protein
MEAFTRRFVVELQLERVRDGGACDLSANLGAILTVVDSTVHAVGAIHLGGRRTQHYSRVITGEVEE